MDETLGPSMFSRLGGMQDTGASMFGTMTQPLAPSTEESEAALERVKFKKHILSKGYHARIFDMHDDKQRVKYEKLMDTLFMGVQAKTHRIWVNEFDLLTTPKGQHWHRYVEWNEFELEVEATKPIGS